MKNRLFLLLVCIFTIISCYNKQKNIYYFDNVTEKSEFVIKNSNLDGHIFKIELHFHGEIDGSALIIYSDNNDSIGYKPKIEIDKGIVDTLIYTDWYHYECFIHYIPKNVTEGNLLLEYEFIHF